MKNNLIWIWLIGLSVMVAFIFAPIKAGGTGVSDEFIEINTPKTDVVEEINPREQEMYDETLRISFIEDKEEWFVEYKNLYNTYPEFLAKQESIYDVFSKKDLDKLFRVVAAEATEGGFQEKVNVAVTIFNRIESKDFGNSIDEVLTETQFSPLKDGRWQTVEVDNTTILACEYAYIFGITEHSAVFFENKHSDVHSSYADFLFEDSIGHKYYLKREN